jgi:Calcineurin-like phosphoesterase
MRAVSGMTAARSRLLSRRRAIAAAALLLVAAALVVSRPPQGEAATVFSFGVAGDFGANSNTSSVLNAVPASGANAFFALGDFSYNEVTPESAWCDFVKSRVGSSYPFELLAGNHEDDGPDGLIANYAACLPDRLGVQDDYPREYYVDYPAGNPLVRFVMISPQLTFPPSTWSYARGTTHYNWTVTAIDGARSAGIPWVVVGMHKYCLSLVNFPCGTGTDIMNLLVSKKVDLYLQAHDHAYSRTKQLALNGSCTAIPTSSFNANCVADGNPASAYTAGNGTVLATVGSGGRPINAEHPELPQGPFFQAWMGSNFNATWGFLKVDVSDTQLSARFVRGSGGSFADSFTINKSGPPPPTSTPTTAPTTTTTAPGGGVTVTANADSFVQSDVPTAAHGADTSLYVDSSPTKITYLKFDTSALAGQTLTAATLRITTTSSSSSGSPDTQVVHPVSDSSWTESGLTYNTRPGVGAANLGSVSATASNTTYSIPLNASQLQSLIGGQLTLALDSTGGTGDAFYVNSREATTNRPQLLLTTGALTAGPRAAVLGLGAINARAKILTGRFAPLQYKVCSAPI